MSDAYYDVVVVGTDLTGLIASAMLAKRNYRVLVLGQGPLGNELVVDGFKCARRPWLFTGFETSGLVKKAFTELALSLEMQNRPKAFDPFYQVVLPGRRVDVTAKEALYQRELEREFSGETERIGQYHRAIRDGNTRLSALFDTVPILPADGFFESRSWRKTVAQALDAGIPDALALFPEGHPFRAFALAPLLFSSGCQLSPYSAIQATRLQTHLGRGLYDIEGGVDGLKRVFLDKVKSNCGDVRDRAAVERLVVKRGKVREVVLRDRREVIGTDAVLCNMDVKRFFGLIPQEEQNERYHLKIHELQPQWYLYTLNLVVKAQAIPEGMANTVFQVLSAKRPLEGENLTLLCVDPVGPQDDPGTRVISVSTRVLSRNMRPTLEHLAELDQRLIHATRQLVPFLDEHLITTASAWVVTDRRTGERMVDTNLITPIYGTPLEETLETTPIACRTAYKNLLVGSDALYSGLGFEGAFFGALNAFRLTTELVSKKTLLG